MELGEAARALTHYEEVCRERGWLSFADLIVLPIRILKTSTHAAAILRDEWRHMVVDEFQDVNPAQIELLRLLMPPTGASYERRAPDLCVVGDDDQSIYMFRGADDLAFQRFAKIWLGHRTVGLSRNYRSTPAIVGVANATIARAGRRFAPGKRIVPEAKSAGEADRVECVYLEDEMQDGDVIAAAVLADRREHPGRSWCEYAVVARTNKDADRIRAAMEIEDIPTAGAKGIAPSEDQGVRDALAWVELLADPYCAYAAWRLLTRPPFSMALPQARGLLGAYRGRLTRFQTGDPAAADPGGFAEWLAAFAPDGPLASAFVRAHAELREFSAAHNAASAVVRIITLADPAHADLLSGRDRAVRVVNLVALVRFARERQQRLEPPGDVRSFWSYYQDLSGADRELRTGQLDDRVDGAASASGDDPDEPDAVRIITAHKAKGLEFHTVFVPRVSPGSGYGAVKEEDERRVLPEGLVPGEDESRAFKERAREEQRRRLFYVACTRAERRLVLLAKKNKSASKSVHFFEEIADDPKLNKIVRRREGVELIRARAAQFGPGRRHGWAGPGGWEGRGASWRIRRGSRGTSGRPAADASVFWSRPGAR